MDCCRASLRGQTDDTILQKTALLRVHHEVNEFIHNTYYSRHWPLRHSAPTAKVIHICSLEIAVTTFHFFD
jgi:hypothetical protein